jgi:hypothetical protein
VESGKWSGCESENGGDDCGIAGLFECLHDVRVVCALEEPARATASRGRCGVLNLSQLKILQEVITLAVFVPFAILYMRQPVKLDFLWAGVCLMGAVYFIFRA